MGDDGHSWEMNATAFSAAPQPGLCSTAVLCRQFMRVRRGERASFGVPPGSTLLAVSRAMGLLEPIMVRFAKRDGITVDHRARALDIVFADGNTATIVLDADSEQLRYVRCSAELPIERSQYDLASLDPSSPMTVAVELPKPGGPSAGQMVAGYLGDGATRVFLPSTLFNILSVTDEELDAIKLP